MRKKLSLGEKAKQRFSYLILSSSAYFIHIKFHSSIWVTYGLEEQMNELFKCKYGTIHSGTMNAVERIKKKKKKMPREWGKSICLNYNIADVDLSNVRTFTAAKKKELSFLNNIFVFA